MDAETPGGFGLMIVRTKFGPVLGRVPDSVMVELEAASPSILGLGE